jgi:hypothetical protein
MPWDRKRYPPDWKSIRQAILERAEGRCEGSRIYPDCRAVNGEPHPVTGSKVVLTCAHIIDPDPMNCDPANLRALCQRCHLAIDRPHHLAKQRRNRLERKRRWQPELSLEER